jgi:Putative MetA-pathway of phenol degradation
MNSFARRKGLVSLALLVVLTVTIIPAAFAAEPTTEASVESIVPDRPDFTDGVLVVRALQVEGGVTLSRTGSERELAVGEILVRVPVARRLELRLFAPSYLRVRDHDVTQSGFGDAAAGIKLGLTDGDPASKGIPATAFLVTTTVPTGSDEFSDDAHQPEAKVALEWEFSDHLGIGVNVGYARPSDGGERFDQLFATISAGITISQSVGAFVEVYGFNKAAASGGSATYADTGLSYLVNPNLSLDARIGFGLGNDVEGTESFFGFGVSRRF